MDTVFDARGMVCPLPVLKAKKLLKTIAEGGVIRIEATDPSALKDFPRFCEQTGHKLIETSTAEDGALVFRIRKTTP